MDAENKISIEDEIQVQITHLETLLEETNDVELLKQVMLNLVFLQDKVRNTIGHLYRTNKKTHHLCKKYTTKNGKVVYGYGTASEEGFPMVVCHTCTETKK